MIGLDEEPLEWSVTRCEKLLARTNRYWRDWTRRLKTFPSVDATLKRCAMTVHLLAHAPDNAAVAAVTTSLPERIGGGRNYDYRYTWVRDASISAAFWYSHALAGAGRTDEALAIIRHCEEIAGGPGIFAEEADARRRTMLGNTPQLFSQVEYGWALLAIHKNQSQKPVVHEKP